MLKFLEENRKNISIVLFSILCTLFFSFIFRNINVFLGIKNQIINFFYIIEFIFLLLFTTKYILGKIFIYKILKKIIIILTSIILFLLTFFICWYNICFFPDDEEYLNDIVSQTKYTGDYTEFVKLDLIRNIDKSNLIGPLNDNDLKFLLNPELRTKDICINKNPYTTFNPNNLKYATGKTFYYVYQKNCLVLKSGSSIEYKLDTSPFDSYFESDLVLPDQINPKNVDFVLEGYNGKKWLNIKKIRIEREIKPHIEAFRFSNVLKALIFYIKNPGRSVIKENTGWKKIRVELTSKYLKVRIKIVSSNSKNAYLFLGSPRIYEKRNISKAKFKNVIYILCDTLGQPHLDFYEFPELFKKNISKEASEFLDEDKLVTPFLDSLYSKSIVFNNMITAGEVTRPSIVALWNSQNFTKCRMPVFRNIITDENQEEFYNENFSSLGEILSKNGYITKQISCNAEGHGVSGVGADLGFDENYDYTMEASEYAANFKHIIDFLEENQNRKFLLYTHLNIPHPPRWTPMKDFLKALPRTSFNIDSAKMRGNITYLDRRLKIIFDAIKKLKIDDNTLVVLTADHSCGPHYYFRNYLSDNFKSYRKRESQNVAFFHKNAIYIRPGVQHLNKDFMNIPFVIYPPKNSLFKTGIVNNFISTIDVSPTFIDFIRNKPESRFSGKSFLNILEDENNRSKVHNNFIPMVGRFMSGFIFDGRYKYWRNYLGMYKYIKTDNGSKLIQQQEYLFDLKKDIQELNNLVHDNNYKELLYKMRHLYNYKFEDYPDKNFIQFSASKGKNANDKYSVNISSLNGRIRYIKTYGDGVKILKNKPNDVLVNINTNDKIQLLSFETYPDNSKFKIKIYRNGKKVSKNKIFIGNEKINIFNNPLKIENMDDILISRIYGRTGLEPLDLPVDSIAFYRIPLLYWLEMSKSEKDVNLSPGIKEVLRGWGYIQ